MLSNLCVRLLTSVRLINKQQHFLRLLSTTESNSTENISNNRETGIVKRFSKEKGYGFISKNSDGTDCFVHFKNINITGFKTLYQGQEVEFTATHGEKGPEARDVSIINTGTSRMPFIGDSSSNNSTSSRFGFGNSPRNRSSSSAFDFGGTKSSKFHSTEEESTSAEKSFNFRTGLTNANMDNLFSSEKTPFDNDKKREIGSVKRWTNDRGYGFIRRTNGGPDLFCHVRSLKDGLEALQEGQTVEYTIHRTDKGEEARNVTIFKEDFDSTQQEESNSNINSDERQTGIVKRWIPEKGFGFLRRDTGGSDVFVHRRNLSDDITSLEEGQTVEFNLIKNEKGEMAQNVTVRNET